MSDLKRRSRDSGAGGQGPVLITGGAGFIGSNLAHRLLAEGRDVVLFDNLSRPGVELNLHWLKSVHGSQVEIVIADVRDEAAVAAQIHRASQVFHLAAQVAVTTSLTDPVTDFEINARGTLNVLNAIRSAPNPPSLVFTSTNKVYGALDDVRLTQVESRYVPVSPHIRLAGVSEGRPLAFHSPYGCSKGAADQYVIDYARSFGLRACVFRMSCIYGPHQYGTEDQGWIAHFLIRALAGTPLVFYGDGLQVRDALFVDDLVDAFLLAQENMDNFSGRAFNIGGGPANTTSLLELAVHIEQLTGKAPVFSFADWRMGDQRYYVSNTAAFHAASNWSPAMDLPTGLRALHDWLTTGSESAGARVRARGSSQSQVTLLAGEA